MQEQGTPLADVGSAAEPAELRRTMGRGSKYGLWPDPPGGVETLHRMSLGVFRTCWTGGALGWQRRRGFVGRTTFQVVTTHWKKKTLGY